MLSYPVYTSTPYIPLYYRYQRQRDFTTTPGFITRGRSVVRIRKYGIGNKSPGARLVEKFIIREKSREAELDGIGSWRTASDINNRLVVTGLDPVIGNDRSVNVQSCRRVVDDFRDNKESIGKNEAGSHRRPPSDPEAVSLEKQVERDKNIHDCSVSDVSEDEISSVEHSENSPDEKISSSATIPLGKHLPKKRIIVGEPVVEESNNVVVYIKLNSDTDSKKNNIISSDQDKNLQDSQAEESVEISIKVKNRQISDDKLQKEFDNRNFSNETTNSSEENILVSPNCVESAKKTSTPKKGTSTKKENTSISTGKFDSKESTKTDSEIGLKNDETKKCGVNKSTKKSDVNSSPKNVTTEGIKEEICSAVGAREKGEFGGKAAGQRDKLEEEKLIVKKPEKNAEHNLIDKPAGRGDTGKKDNLTVDRKGESAVKQEAQPVRKVVPKTPPDGKLKEADPSKKDKRGELPNKLERVDAEVTNLKDNKSQQNSGTFSAKQTGNVKADKSKNLLNGLDPAEGELSQAVKVQQTVPTSKITELNSTALIGTAIEKSEKQQNLKVGLETANESLAGQNKLQRDLKDTLKQQKPPLENKQDKGGGVKNEKVGKVLEPVEALNNVPEQKPSFHKGEQQNVASGKVKNDDPAKNGIECIEKNLSNEVKREQSQKEVSRTSLEQSSPIEGKSQGSNSINGVKSENLKADNEPAKKDLVNFPTKEKLALKGSLAKETKATQEASESTNKETGRNLEKDIDLKGTTLNNQAKPPSSQKGVQPRSSISEQPKVIDIKKCDNERTLKEIRGKSGDKPVKAEEIKGTAGHIDEKGISCISSEKNLALNEAVEHNGNIKKEIRGNLKNGIVIDAADFNKDSKKQEFSKNVVANKEEPEEKTNNKLRQGALEKEKPIGKKSEKLKNDLSNENAKQQNILTNHLGSGKIIKEKGINDTSDIAKKELNTIKDVQLDQNGVKNKLNKTLNDKNKPEDKIQVQGDFIKNSEIVNSDIGSQQICEEKRNLQNKDENGYVNIIIEISNDSDDVLKPDNFEEDKSQCSSSNFESDWESVTELEEDNEMEMDQAKEVKKKKKVIVKKKGSKVKMRPLEAKPPKGDNISEVSSPGEIYRQISKKRMSLVDEDLCCLVERKTSITDEIIVQEAAFLDSMIREEMKDRRKSSLGFPAIPELAETPQETAAKPADASGQAAAPHQEDRRAAWKLAAKRSMKTLGKFYRPQQEESSSSDEEECDVNCHRKCQRLTPNLCGVNQKLMAEALSSLNVRGRTSTSSSSSGTKSSRINYSLFSINSSECSSNSSSSTPTVVGRVSPPAKTLPRFRSYSIQDFQFLKVLGKGSFGKVLLAELKGSECYYAVKCLKKDVVLEDDDVECTMIERKVLALATGHPYFSHLFCTFQTQSHLFFVMEYLNGGDLMFHIQQSGRFDEGRARFYAAEIVSGLTFLHKWGIVYRDLKLDNVLLDFDGHVRIADFGMCKLQIYLDKTTDTFCGTPDYMAPEIIKGLKYNQCVDWWSFGILLYELLVGQSPFSGCDEDDLFWSICNSRPHMPSYLSAPAKSILNALLTKDCTKRLGSSENGSQDVMNHTFFDGLKWHLLERKQLDPPFKPTMKHPLDTKYFDKVFTSEKPILTPVDKAILESMDQSQFQGFSYTNPNATE